MLGIRLEQGHARVADDLPEPDAVPGETRVRVRLAGVCGTDLALLRGYMDFEGVPGHEFVGVALEGPLAGRRVVGDINAACGTCPRCRAGDPHHCPRRTVLGILGRPGAFAEILALPTANLVPVPDAVPDEHAVFAEPLAAALRVVEQVPLDGDTRALVVGDGRLGLLVAHALAVEGAPPVVRGRHPERAALLPPGARFEPAQAPAPAPGDGYDLVVEASGDPAALDAAVAATRPGGTVVLKTTRESGAPFDATPLVVDEIRLLGSRCGPIPRAVRALVEAPPPLEAMIAARFPLTRGDEALAAAGRPGVLKVLIEVERP